MDVREAIKGRRSIRRYTPQEVPDAALREVLDAGHMAPSAGNMQGRDFIIVKDPEIKSAICAAALGQTFIEEAPVCIVVCANFKRSKRRYGQRSSLYAIQDADIATTNMMLMAHSLGLGTCWVGAFDENAVSKILGIPADVRPVAILPLGYPYETNEAPPRLGEKIEHKERW